MPFQKQVNVSQAPAVQGDWCDGNPRYFVDAGPGGLVAGPNGVIVGNFCWATNPDDGDGAPATVYSHGSGPVTGFVHRNQQALITAYLAESGLLIQAGFGMEVLEGGGVWALNSGATEALPGMKAYANFVDGSITFAATGNVANGGSATGTIAAGAGATITGSIDDDTLTVTATTATIQIGGKITGTDGTNTIVANTYIVAQLSGAPGGAGTYAISIPEQTIEPGTAITETWGVFNAASALSGTFAIGETISGGTTAAGTIITAFGTGNGGLGTYIVNKSQTVSSATLSTSSNIETKWFCRSAGAPGEIVKINDHPQG